MLVPKGKKHGTSIKGGKKSKVYEGLRSSGMSKTRAAKIANSGPKGWHKGGKKSGK
jgi:hypothetical protein